PVLIEVQENLSMTTSHRDTAQRLLPRLTYDDAPAAIEFLCRAFGFEERARFAPGGKVVYAEMALDGQVVFAVGTSHESVLSPRRLDGSSVELFCYVDDVDTHFERAKASGASIVSPLEDKFWGDRSYAAVDCEGHRWTFRTIKKEVPLRDSKPIR